MSEKSKTAEKQPVEITVAAEKNPPAPKTKQPAGEIGGPAGPEPTRFGDWEVGGRCSDF